MVTIEPFYGPNALIDLKNAVGLIKYYKPYHPGEMFSIVRPPTPYALVDFSNIRDALRQLAEVENGSFLLRENPICKEEIPGSSGSHILVGEYELYTQTDRLKAHMELRFLEDRRSYSGNVHGTLDLRISGETEAILRNMGRIIKFADLLVMPSFDSYENVHFLDSGEPELLRKIA